MRSTHRINATVGTLGLATLAGSTYAQPALTIRSEIEIVISDESIFDSGSDVVEMQLPFRIGAGLEHERSGFFDGPSGTGPVFASTSFSVDAIRRDTVVGAPFYEIDISGRLVRSVPDGISAGAGITAASDLTFGIELSDDIDAPDWGSPRVASGTVSYESNQTGLPAFSISKSVFRIDELLANGKERPVFDFQAVETSDSTAVSVPFSGIFGSDFRLSATSDLSDVLVSRAGTSVLEFDITLAVFGTVPSPGTAGVLAVVGLVAAQRRR
ncbi:MAG: hypothetical protein AAGB48_02210 [Planctomycetota bacterium]